MAVRARRGSIVGSLLGAGVALLAAAAFNSESGAAAFADAAMRVAAWFTERLSEHFVI